MLNKSIIISVISSLFLALTIQASEEIQLYSEAGYPYKNLIHKAKAVNILFIKEKRNITCHVSISLASGNKITKNVNVSVEQFEEDPLVGCLPRTEAKKLLKFAYL